MTRPNLLFVFADQMRGMDMGCAGNTEVLTPHLDRFATEGTRFSHTYANCPVCTPSRAIMLTGRYPFSNRTLANDLPLPPDIPSIGKTLKEAGYRTGYIGKWHLDGVPRNRFTPPGPRRHGFDKWCVWNCDHNYWKGRYFKDTPEIQYLEGYEPVGQTDLAIDFLNQENERPFCLFLSWGPPHDPYTFVPDQYPAMYHFDELTLRKNLRTPEFTSKDPCLQYGPHKCLGLYYSAITALDEQFGRLMKTLEVNGLVENTIVVFTSDHGDMLFSQGNIKKQQPYEEAVAIPFLVRWPGQIPANRIENTMISTVDFTPTLLSLMNVPAMEGVEGDDLSRVFLGKETQLSRSALLMDVITLDEAFSMGLSEWRALRTPRYTYARWLNGKPWFLFDNDNDPWQLNNLVDHQDYRDLVNQLDSELQTRLVNIGDPLLPFPDIVHHYDLVELWNAREAELYPNGPQRELHKS